MSLPEAPGYTVVKDHVQLCLAGIERRPVRLDLAAYPHLPKLVVQTTRAADYTALMPQIAA